jgi:hypothetical protein
MNAKQKHLSPNVAALKRGAGMGNGTTVVKNREFSPDESQAFEVYHHGGGGIGGILLSSQVKS